MCNEVCMCHEMDQCCCPNMPIPDFKQVIKDVMKNNKAFIYKKITFYRDSKDMFGLGCDFHKKDDTKSLFEEIHTKILDMGFDLYGSNFNESGIYSIFIFNKDLY